MNHVILLCTPVVHGQLTALPGIVLRSIAAEGGGRMQGSDVTQNTSVRGEVFLCMYLLPRDSVCLSRLCLLS